MSKSTPALDKLALELSVLKARDAKRTREIPPCAAISTPSTALSADTLARSRKTAATILQRLSSVGQAALADALGVSESNISRWKVEKTAIALTVLGLRVVRDDEQTVDPDKLRALVALAEDGFAALKANLGKGD